MFNINISHTHYDEVFVQTNFIKKGKITSMSNCEYLKMTEEDAKELAKTLSSICETVFEDINHHCTVFLDEEVIREYDNE